MVFYRKYRPQKIDDFDSQVVRETLISVLSKNPPHAFLFTGPKGLGKTSAARIVAKVVNCTGRPANKEQRTKNKEQKDSKLLVQSSKLDASASIEPCNKCEQCTSITDGTNMDVLEIDAASNRGIDEIRDLKEKIRLSPMEARRKVYIIDEVHMLTTEAFNALLKTLEEPPSHAMFILCTTEPQKVPETIISRCLHINFSRATSEELIRSFKRVVKAEKIAAPDNVLQMIANLSEGSFRDGIKILEEIASLSKGKITEKLVEEKYKVASIKYHVSSMLEAFEKRDVKEGFEIIGGLGKDGVDFKYFIECLLEELHKYLLVEIGVQNTKIQDTKLSIEEIKVLFGLLSNAYAEIKYAVIQQLPLEMAIIEWTSIAADTKEPNERDNISISSLRKQVGNIAKVKAMYGSAPAKQSLVEDKSSKISAVELMHAPASGQVSKQWLETLWKNIISEMKNYNHTVAGVLRGCRLESYDKKNLIIQTGYKFHKERLDDNKTKDELTRVCKMLIGKDVAVVVELKKS